MVGSVRPREFQGITGERDFGAGMVGSKVSGREWERGCDQGSHKGLLEQEGCKFDFRVLAFYTFCLVRV